MIPTFLKNFKRIFSMTAVFVLFFSIFFVARITLTPQYAHAQEVVDDPVTEIETGLTTVETGNTAVSSNVTATDQTMQEVKTFTLDPIATAIAKQLLQQITISVVNWINTGFKGSPSFVQNPGQFFENIGDQIAGNFLAANSDLAASLCSPFNINVRVALALQISGGSGIAGQSQYACSLSTMINNATNAVKGASINGFTAGDFRQGGWPAFLALTTVPANSPNGAFLQAEANLSLKISNQQSIKQTQLAQGNGFLSWTTCTPDPDWPADADDPYSDGSGQDCEVQTPGSTIENALNKGLDVPTENLELANDFNAVINATFSYLVTTVLKSGLTSVSQPNTNGLTYLDQVASANAPSLQKLETNAIATLKPSITAETTIAKNTSTALGLALNASTTLSNVLACDNGILADAALPNANPESTSFADSQLSQIDAMSSTTASLIAQFTGENETANSTLESFGSIDNSISSATSADDLATTSEEIQLLATSGELPTASDAHLSTNELTDAKKTLAPINVTAGSLLTQCMAFSTSTTALTGIDSAKP